MFGHQNKNGRDCEEFGNAVSLDMSQHFGKVKAGHDVDGNALVGEVADEVALTKGMVHRQKAERRSSSCEGLVVRIEFMKTHHADTVGDEVIVGYLNTFWNSCLLVCQPTLANKEGVVYHTVPEL